MAQYTIYATDECIRRTKVEDDSGITYVVDYDEGPMTGSYNGSIEFTAVAASGCVFTRWVYRLGSTTAAQKTSTSNPFTYSGGQNIYIRAEGEIEEGEEEWTLVSSSEGLITEQKDYSVSIASNTLYRYKVSFDETGTVIFYSSGKVDTIGYISETSAWEPADGEPTYGVSDDDSGDSDNFYLEYDVIEGENYYFWFRGYKNSTTGSTTITIIPPSSTEKIAISLVSILENSIAVKVTGLSGNYNSTRTCTWYIGTGTPAEHGSQTIAANATESSQYTFSSLVANTTYYIYCVIEGNGGSFSVRVPESGYIEAKTSAVTSGQNCYIYTSAGWKLCTAYIYTSSGWKPYNPTIYKSSNAGWIS